MQNGLDCRKLFFDLIFIGLDYSKLFLDVIFIGLDFHNFFSDVVISDYDFRKLFLDVVISDYDINQFFILFHIEVMEFHIRSLLCGVYPGFSLFWVNNFLYLNLKIA